MAVIGIFDSVHLLTNQSSVSDKDQVADTVSALQATETISKTMIRHDVYESLKNNWSQFNLSHAAKNSKVTNNWEQKTIMLRRNAACQEFVESAMRKEEGLWRKRYMKQEV